MFILTGSAMGDSLRYREIGAGPFVLCIDSFASSSAQYRGLMQRLAPHFRVVAADLYGHGNSPMWSGNRQFTLADEAAPLEALLPDDVPVHLVGHSYGASVALRIAGANRGRICSMTLYEPAIWGTLSNLRPSDPATREIEAVRDTLPAAKVVELDGLGHLGPITHPEPVESVIEMFLLSSSRHRPRVRSDMALTAAAELMQ